MAAPSNNLIENATVVTLPFHDTVVTHDATDEPSDPVGTTGGSSPTAVPLGKSVYYSFTGAGANIIIDLVDSDFDTVLVVWRLDNDTQRTWNDEYRGRRQSRSISFTALDGVEYLIQVGGWGGASGNLDVKVDLAANIPHLPFTEMPDHDQFTYVAVDKDWIRYDTGTGVLVSPIHPDLSDQIRNWGSVRDSLNTAVNYKGRHFYWRDHRTLGPLGIVEHYEDPWDRDTIVEATSPPYDIGPDKTDPINYWYMINWDYEHLDGGARWDDFWITWVPWTEIGGIDPEFSGVNTSNGVMLGSGPDYDFRYVEVYQDGEDRYHFLIFRLKHSDWYDIPEKMNEPEADPDDWARINEVARRASPESGKWDGQHRSGHQEQFFDAAFWNCTVANARAGFGNNLQTGWDIPCEPSNNSLFFTMQSQIPLTGGIRGSHNQQQSIIPPFEEVSTYTVQMTSAQFEWTAPTAYLNRGPLPEDPDWTFWWDHEYEDPPTLKSVELHWAVGARGTGYSTQTVKVYLLDEATYQSTPFLIDGPLNLPIVFQQNVTDEVLEGSKVSDVPVGTPQGTAIVDTNIIDRTRIAICPTNNFMEGDAIPTSSVPFTAGGQLRTNIWVMRTTVEATRWRYTYISREPLPVIEIPPPPLGVVSRYPVLWGGWLIGRTGDVRLEAPQSELDESESLEPWAWYRADDSTSPVGLIVDRAGGSGDLELLSGSQATIDQGANGQDVFDFASAASYESLTDNPSGADGITLVAIAENFQGSAGLEIFCSTFSGDETFGFIMDGEMSGETSTLFVESPSLDDSLIVAVWRFGLNGITYFIDNVVIGSDATAQNTNDVAALRISAGGGVRLYDAMVFDRELDNEEIIGAVWDYSQDRYGP